MVRFGPSQEDAQSWERLRKLRGIQLIRVQVEDSRYTDVCVASQTLGSFNINRHSVNIHSSKTSHAFQKWIQKHRCNMTHQFTFLPFNMLLTTIFLSNYYSNLLVVIYAQVCNVMHINCVYCTLAIRSRCTKTVQSTNSTTNYKEV